jgi:hypothetical protein
MGRAQTRYNKDAMFKSQAVLKLNDIKSWKGKS